MRLPRLFRTILAFAVVPIAIGTADRLLERHYYGRTLSYYQTADVYWEDQHTLLLYLPDPTVFWSLKPGILLRATEDANPPTLRPPGSVRRLEWEIRVGSKGFRGPDFPGRKPAEELRIVCIGDSRTMGEGLEEHETYPARLQYALGDTLRGGVRVLNLGHDGWSSYQGLVLFRNRVLAYAPDVAIFAFGVNDTDTDWGVSDRQRARRVNRPFVTAQRTLYRSMSFYWAQRQFLRAKGWLMGKKRVAGSRRHLVEESPVPRVNPREYQANLREFVRLCHANGVLPVLLAIPPNPYRDWTDWLVQPDGSDAYSRAKSHRQRGEYDAAHAQFVEGLRATVFAELTQTAKRVAAEEDAVMVDLTPTFLDLAPHAVLYIDEVHPNPQGAALIAHALAESLRPRVRAVSVAQVQ